MPSDSLWVASRVDLADRSETVELAERLGVSMVTAIGHLHLLWHHCMKVKPNGDLSSYGAKALAWACHWDGDPDVLRSALFDGEWIDKDGVVHNWGWYYDRLKVKREGNRERQQRRRERERGVTNRELWDRDSGQCRYCGEPVALRQMHVDHVVPLHLGGTEGADNLVTACRGCNLKKFNRTVESAGMRLLGVPSRLFDGQEPVVGHVGHALPPTRRNALQTNGRHALPTARGHALQTAQTGPDDGSGPVGNALLTTDEGSESPESPGGHALQTTGRFLVGDGPRGRVVTSENLGKSATIGSIQLSATQPQVALSERAAEDGSDGDGATYADDFASVTSVTPSVTRDVTRSNASTLTGLTLTGDRDLTGNDVVEESLETPTSRLTGSSASKGKPTKAEKLAARQAAAERVYAYYKQRIQPGSRVVPIDKIMKRLESFPEAELIQGIDRFAADWWRMENNVGGGYSAKWFFDSDAQAEKWRDLIPKPARNGRVSAAPTPDPSDSDGLDWIRRMELANDAIPVRRLEPSNVDPHSTVAPSDVAPEPYPDAVTSDELEVAF